MYCATGRTKLSTERDLPPEGVEPQEHCQVTIS